VAIGPGFTGNIPDFLNRAQFTNPLLAERLAVELLFL
jgi:hypothetical protein